MGSEQEKGRDRAVDGRKPRIVKITKAGIKPAILQEAVAILKGGGLVAFPTETVYGIGVDAFNDEAVESLRRAKNRPPGAPFALQIGSMDQLANLLDGVPSRARAVMDAFWPGPLTIILPAGRNIAGLTGIGGSTVGLRFPGHPVARALPEALGRPLAATSANLSNRPSPTMAQHVREDFGVRVDIVLDGGPSIYGVESTVLDLVSSTPQILRAGVIEREALEIVLGQALALKTQGRSGGYRPAIPLFLCNGDVEEAWREIKGRGFQKPGIIGGGEKYPWAIQVKPLTGNETGLKSLYGAMREMETNCDVILAISPREGPYADLIKEKLKRAAQNTDNRN